MLRRPRGTDPDSAAPLPVRTLKTLLLTVTGAMENVSIATLLVIARNWKTTQMSISRRADKLQTNKLQTSYATASTTVGERKD